jgi:hypothetical protein
MTSFNEWLYQRDENIYNEMFDQPKQQVPKNSINYFDVKLPEDDKGNVIISFSGRGVEAIGKMTNTVNKLRRGKLQEMGNQLLGKIELLDSSAYKDRDIDVSSIRRDIKSEIPDAEMALDAILKRFATRTGKRLGNNGNLLFTRSNALKQTQLNPSLSKTGRYAIHTDERDAESNKQERLAGYRKRRKEQQGRNAEFIAGYVLFIKLYQNIKIHPAHFFKMSLSHF